MALVGRFAATRVIVVIYAHLHASHVTANVELFVLLFGLIEVILRVLLAATSISALLFISIIYCGLLGSSGAFTTGVLAGCFEDDGMHAVNRGATLILAREEFLAAYGTGNDVADKRIPFWQVCGEVHLLPVTSKTDV